MRNADELAASALEIARELIAAGKEVYTGDVIQALWRDEPVRYRLWAAQKALKQLVISGEAITYLEPLDMKHSIRRRLYKCR